MKKKSDQTLNSVIGSFGVIWNFVGYDFITYHQSLKKAMPMKTDKMKYISLSIVELLKINS